MNEWQPEKIRRIMVEAGTIALQHFENPRTEHKKDFSLVTVADTTIERALREHLQEPGASFIGEESALSMTQQEIEDTLAGVCWIVDPIDGTAPYANQLPTWGISIARMVHGVITEGALFLPRTGELFITSGAAVLYQRGPRDLSFWKFEPMEELSSVADTYTTTGMVSLPQEMRRKATYAGTNPFQCNGSAVYSIAKTITGSYQGYIARIRLWDLAGAIPILRRLNFHIEFADHEALAPNISRTDWNLNAGDPNLWKCRGLLYISRSRETVMAMQRDYREAELSK